MRVLVTGGRSYADRKRLYSVMDSYLSRDRSLRICEGGAAGADSLAREWAWFRDVPCVTFRPDWSQGKSAGPIRNSRMLKEFKPDLVVAFPGGSGTQDMVRKAVEAKVKVEGPWVLDEKMMRIEAMAR